MSLISDNKKLTLINIPATHDSTAYYMNRISMNLAQTQYYTIQQQLQIGTRKFDVRVANINKNKETDEDLICCHGICDCYASDDFGNFKKLTFKSVIIDMVNFLQNHPSEIVMIGISLGRGKDSATVIRAYELFKKLVGENNAVEYNPDLILGNVRGKFVYFTNMREEPDKKDINKKLICSKNLINGTGIGEVHKKYKDYATFKVNGNLKIQEMKDMFQLYNMTLEQAEIEEAKKSIKFPIEYSISCTGEKDYCFPSPIYHAGIVHPFVQKNGVIKKGYYYGWLKMDFANYQTNYKIIDSNFVNFSL